MIIYPLLARGRDRLETQSACKKPSTNLEIPYSLGDAIDWKHQQAKKKALVNSFTPLLARGRDRLETSCKTPRAIAAFGFPYSLGDAIYWKLFIATIASRRFISPTR
ncbi:MAG: hypothetical protein ACK47J_21990 [Pseudanabaena sp.]